MTAAKREIIYIDVEDEITSVIDKVVSAKSSVIGLVPPKRAAMLQSIVNMKLLKRSAEQANKKIVLVTSEASLLPLAAMSKIHVAKNLQSKPYIPTIEPAVKAKEPIEEPEASDAEMSVGELAMAAAPATEDLIEAVPTAGDEAPAPAPKAPKKTAKTKKDGPHIPNFDSFRSRVLLGVGALILIIGGWFVLFKLLPKATISIKADTTQINLAETITAQPGLKDADNDKALLPAVAKQEQKTLTQTFTPKGQKNVGDKAKGTVTVTNCDSNDTETIPAGTSFTNGSFVFTSDAATDVPGSSFKGGKCQNDGTVGVPVTATQAGDTYNLSPRSYSISGVAVLVTGYGGQMSGGTNKTITVVSDDDVAQAKTKLNAQDTTETKNDLKKLIGNGYTILDDSFAPSPGTTTVNPAVGTEGSSATLTIDTTFSLVGIKTDSLKGYVATQAKKHFDPKLQKIFDDGLSSATLKSSKKGDTNYQVSLATDVFVGPLIDDGQLAKQITGRRIGEADELIRKIPGVRDVHVGLSPFYIRSLPRPSRIKILYDVQNAKPIQ